VPNGKLPAAKTTAVHLQKDGYLRGKLNVLDSAGRPSPAKGKVSFLQNGQVVAVAQVDLGGVFQAAGLKPGVYSVIASGPDGFAAMTVQVLPYVENAPPAELVSLDMTLVPLDGADALSDLLAQTPPGTPAPPADPAAYGGGGYGGGGGGGGGLGALGIVGAALGAAGLGLGIGALANEEASPSKF
jgi:hypothetical protein